MTSSLLEANPKNVTSRIRHRFTLQQEVQTPDNAGGYTRSWENVADVWGEIVAWRGKEIPFGVQMESQITHRILLRYRDGITDAMRLVFEERIFKIVYVFTTDALKETLQLMVEEGVGT